MFKKIFSLESKTITSAAIIVGAASLISRLIGVIRDRVLAGQFGAGRELDIYYAAFRIPDLVFNLIVLGALSAGFIPVFTNYLADKPKAWRLVNVLINVLLIVLGLLGLLLIFLAPWLMKIIVPGFGPTELATTVAMTRIMFLAPIFLGLSGILGGILQSYKQFFVYSLAPIMYNLGIIVGAIFLTPFFGIYGLAFGVVLGAGAHMLIQLPAVMVIGYRYRPIIDLKDQGFIQIIKMMGPRVMTLLVSQINLVVITVIASSMVVGSLTIFNFANNLQSFPLGIFGIAFAVAAFPTLSQLAKNKKEFINTLSATTRQILFFIIPASVLLIILRAQIVRVVLGSGKFDWQDTILTLETLSFFAFSLFAQALIVLLIRAFYALEDSKTPFYVGLVAAFANVILAMILAESIGVAGLGLSISLASILNLLILVLILHYRLGYLDGTKIVLETLKMLLATAFLTLFAQGTKYLIEPFFGTATFVGVAVQGFLAALVGFAVYLFIAWLLKIEEFKYFVDFVQKRLFRKSAKIVEIIESE
ncbi:MAG: murein biosynthesis integral membrane protein MurJ [Candidatus Buchananbacteria bacterium]|nr:murein biosynthesis integral membrane protein MurJ [Candidatus Buchananbacteria bacterium]